MVEFSKGSSKYAARTLVVGNPEEQGGKEAVIAELERNKNNSDQDMDIDSTSLLAQAAQARHKNKSRRKKETEEQTEPAEKSSAETEVPEEDPVKPPVKPLEKTRTYTIEAEFGSFSSEYRRRYVNKNHICLVYALDSPVFIPGKGNLLEIEFEDEERFKAESSGITFKDSDRNEGYLILTLREDNKDKG